VLLAELEIRHSRPIAPTRRIALGEDVYLPTEPPPGFGGILLGCIVATFSQELDEELSDELDDLLEALEQGRHVRQPQLRHRYQVDVIGLDRSHHRLYGEGESYHLDLELKGHPMPQILGAAYAAGMLSRNAKAPVFRLLRKATLWAGEPGPKLLAYLLGGEAASRTWTTAANDEGWALTVLGFDDAQVLDADDIGRRYRDLVRLAHPDSGGDATVAGHRITELNEARRVLLRVVVVG